MESHSQISDMVDQFMPHGHCILWRPDLLIAHVGSDVLIGLSYMSIPIAIVVFLKKRKDFTERGTAMLFVAFIVACGLSHWIAAWNFWHSHYWLEGGMKVITAAVSVVTAILLWPLIPKLLQIPSQTALNAANEKLRTLNEDLERQVADRTKEIIIQKDKAMQSFRMAGVGEMASALAHEINTPLGIISGRARMIRKLVDKGEYNADSLKTSADDIEHTVERMAGIISAVQKLSRTESKTETEQKTLSVLVSDTIRIYNEKFQNMGIEFNVNVTDPAWESVVEVQPVGLYQVLMNLLNNAMYAVKKAPTKKIEIAAANIDDHHVGIKVIDSGAGVSNEDKAKIFESFYTTKPVGEGTGLGLSVSRSILELFGAELVLESPRDPTTFVVKLRKA